MTAPFTVAEQLLAAALYGELVGYDLAARLPLRCQGPYQQRQWCAVARLAVSLVRDADGTAPPAEAVHVGFALPPIAIPSPPIGASAVR